MKLARSVITLILSAACFSAAGFCQSLAESGPVRIASLKVDVEVVTVNAAIIDSLNRPVTGLEAQHFQLWEDKVEQHIDYFSEEETPLSVGLIFDISGSMENSISASRDAAVTFLKLGNKEDEYFLVEFSDVPRLTQDWTHDITTLRTHIFATEAMGRTALYNAVYIGLDKLKTAHNARKALLLITDGGDNHSGYRASEIKEVLKEQDVQIYAIGIGQDWEFEYADPYSGFGVLPAPYKFGKDTIEEITGPSGSQAFFLKSTDELQDICTTIARQLKSEYVIGYKSTNSTKDGKWRKIRLMLRPPKGLRDFEIRSRSGYYAETVAGESKAK